MKNYKIRRFDSDVNVVEFKVNKNNILTLVGGADKNLKIVNDKDNKWFEDNGYNEIAGMNSGFFMPDGTHCGISYSDYGATFNGDYTGKNGIQAAIFMDGRLIVDDIDKNSFNAKYKSAYWICEGSYALLKNGVKNLDGKEHFSHYKYRHPRSMLGQKEDGTILMVVVDGRSNISKGVTANMQYEIMKELGCVNAINFDGGGSSTLTFNNKTVNNVSGSSERRVSSALKVYSKELIKDEVGEVVSGNKVFKLTLDAGHGLPTPGRRTLEDNPVKEWEMNNKVCLFIEEMFEDYEIEILRVDDITGEKDIPLDDRIFQSNKWGADFYYSRHHNGYQENIGTGVEVYHPFGNGEEISKLLVEKESKYLGLANRGSKTKQYPGKPDGTSYFAVNRNTDCVGILGEGGFMTHKNDIPIITSEEGQRLAAKAVFESIVEYFKIPKKSIKPTEPKESYRKIFTIPNIGTHTKCNFLFSDVKEGMEIYVKEYK